MRFPVEVDTWGEATARNVMVTLEAVEGETGHVPKFHNETYPCDLPPDHSEGVHPTMPRGSAARMLLVSSWTDDRGPQETRVVTPIF